MLKFEKKAAPPMFGVRMTPEDKAWVEKALNEIYDKINGKRKKDEKVISKGQIIAEALRLGLPALKKKMG